MAGVPPRGRKFGEASSEHPELNELVALMRAWIRNAGLNGSSVLDKLTPDHFGEEGAPGRTKFYELLKGNGLDWTFVEAIAEVCSPNFGTQECMLGEAQPLWQIHLKAMSAQPAASQQQVANLENQVIKLQEEVVAEKERLLDAQEKNARISNQLFGLSLHVQMLIRVMQYAVDRLARERDVLATDNRAGDVRLATVTRELSAVEDHEREAVEELRRIHRDLKQVRELADSAERRISFLRHRTEKSAPPARVDLPAASSDGSHMRLVPAPQAAPDAESAVDFGAALSDVRASIEDREEELHALQEVITGPKGTARHGSDAVVRPLSGTAPDNALPGAEQPLPDGTSSDTASALSARPPDNADDADPAEALHERYAAAARERVELADRCWREGQKMMASKVWSRMGTIAEPGDLAYSVHQLLSTDRAAEADLAMNSVAKREPEQLPEIVRELFARCSHQSGMWLLDVIGRIREPAYIPDVLEALRGQGMWAASWRVLGAVGLYRYPGGIPPVLNALREMRMEQDIELVLGEIWQRPLEEQRQVRIALLHNGEHRWAAWLQNVLEPPPA